MTTTRQWEKFTKEIKERIKHRKHMNRKNIEGSTEAEGIKSVSNIFKSSILLIRRLRVMKKN